MTPQHASGTDRLAAYRAKRSADTTPEPFNDGGLSGAGIFVVQKHAATRLHYDLRLEHNGVLMSWAVPAGISHDPTVKRFAVHTEDHPIEYADFEGVIPKGEYGGGEMIVWDRGAVTFDEEPAAGLVAGKLLFTLSGYKLHGQWTLVQMNKEPTEWLLIKKPDAWARDEDDDPPSEQSVLSGLTVEDLCDTRDRASGIHDFLESHDAPEGAVDATSLDLMLAKIAEGPFTDEAWLFEVKYDGYRLVAGKDGRNVHLRYRSGLDATAVFPDITSALKRLPFDQVVIDGEVVVLDSEGHPNFQTLQKRGRLTNRHDINMAATRSPSTFFGFDLMGFDEFDLRGLPLAIRKEALEAVLPTLGPLRYADHFVGVGTAMFDQVVAMGLEGIMAKRTDSRYVAGRSDLWLKIRIEHANTFAIVGYTVPKDKRGGFGALHLGLIDNGKLTYAGRVGTGFSNAQLTELRSRLEPLVKEEPQVLGDTPRGDEHLWVEPTLACSVRYKEITDTGSLRHPVFVDYDDIDLHGIYELEPDRVRQPPPPDVVDARITEPTNTDKVFWPDDGYTKGDLINYYTKVADHLLPYLADRPLVLDRYPDGIDGKSFFQKNAPDFAPDWIRTQWVGNTSGRGNTYFVVDDVEGLRYVANLASIPLHIWASRRFNIENPDWCILDLDPKDAPFVSVITVAKEIRTVCESMGLPSYVKTSGKTGLHVLIPMGGAFTFDQQKLLGELLARVVESRLGELATTVRDPAARSGKVYLDYLQNGKGKLIVGPYSVRPVAGATVSTPLRWEEVTPSLDVTRFTIASTPRRLASMRDDPMLPVLTEIPDIVGGLRRLAKEYSG
jgi:bifunctional non-homologous end joining protein LigD